MPKKGGAGRDRAKGHKYSRGQRVQDDDEIEKRNAQISSEEEEEEQEGEGESNKEVEEGSEEEESSDDDEEGTKERKPKGPSGLIQTANLNRDGPKKENLKLTDAAATAKPELSRREREELEKERRRKNYLKAYEQGKTPEARADLARLQKIRAEREAAARRKEDEVKAKQDAKDAARSKARGSKTAQYL